jgi:hypothetical protein
MAITSKTIGMEDAMVYLRFTRIARMDKANNVTRQQTNAVLTPSTKPILIRRRQRPILHCQYKVEAGMAVEIKQRTRSVCVYS